jgi:hypothetical protein
LTTIAIVTALLAGCAKPDAAQQSIDSNVGNNVAAAPAKDANGQPQQGKQPRGPTRIEDAHLENVYQVHTKVRSPAASRTATRRLSRSLGWA